MGGRVGFTSGLGVGSRFWFDLPLPGMEPPGERSSIDATLAQTNALVARRLRVLVAEDNHTNQLVARGVLQRLGCRVDVVGDGAEAVGAAAKHAYDIVLMDIAMPGMDGIEATMRAP